MTFPIPSVIPVVAAWLATYLLHSTALLGLALVLGRTVLRRRLGLQEAVLRWALLGGLLTATLQAGPGLDLVPRGGDPVVPVPAARTMAETAALPPLVHAAETATGVIPSTAPSRPAASSSHGLPLLAAVAVVGLWLAGAALGVLRLGVAAGRLHRVLADRRSFPAGRLVRSLAERLGLRRPVTLSACRRLQVPLAMGLRRPEICFPETTLDELGPRQREALFAHEMAHLGRRDPAWLLVGRLVETLLFIQPLNHVACRRLRALAEYLADDLAVSCTGRGHDLARCLVDVAARLRGPSTTPVAAAALAAPSDLAHRVRRLLRPEGDSSRTPRGTAVLLAVALVATSLVLPVVSDGQAEAGPTRTRTWSTMADKPDRQPAPPAVTPRAPVDPAPAPRPVDPTAVPSPPEAPAQPSAVVPAPAPRPRRVVGRVPEPETVADLERLIETSRRMAGDLGHDLGPHFEDLARKLAEEQEHFAGAFELDEEEMRLLEEHARRAAEAAAEVSRLSAAELRELAERVAAASALSQEEHDELRSEAEAAAREQAMDRREVERLAREARQQAQEHLQERQQEIQELVREAQQRAHEQLMENQEIQQLVREAQQQAREHLLEHQDELRELLQRAREEAQEVLHDRHDVQQLVREAQREAERQLREAERLLEQARREVEREHRRELERREREEERRHDAPAAPQQHQ